MNNSVKPDNVHTMTIFPTQLLSHKWEDTNDLNEQLKSAIFEKESTIDGRTQSNVGGFHSESDLFLWENPCIDELRGMVNSLVGYMANTAGIKEGEQINITMAGWANVVRQGHYHMPHNHPNNLWSGVYYVSEGTPDDSVSNNGLFEFCDPRPAADMVNMEGAEVLRYQVRPQPGLMIMFPSYVNHYVHPFIGDGERISIAFNIKIS